VKTTILIVEDVVLVRVATAAMLEQLGYPVAEAGDGHRALAALAKNPAIGVMVADLGLPGMPGRELIEKARALRPSLRIVVASGYSRASGSGDPVFRDVQYLPKPFDIAELERAVRG